MVLDQFSINRLYGGLENITGNAEVIKSHQPELKSILAQLDKSLKDLMGLSERFQNQVKQLHKQHGFAQQQMLQERIESARVYFTKEITVLLVNPVNKNIRIKPKNKFEQQLQALFLKYRQLIENKLSLIQYASDLLREPIKPEDYQSWISTHKMKMKPKAGSSMDAKAAVSLQLF